MKSLMISLPESTGRRDETLKHMASLGLPMPHVMDGVNGPMSGLRTTIPYEIDNPGSGYLMGPKTVGLALSHHIAWQIVSAWGEPTMILEDDALFCEDWKERMEMALEDTPKDADILMVGSCNTFDKPRLQIKGEVFHVAWPQCTHGYIVWPKAVPMLVATQRKIWAPIDLALVLDSFPRMRVYTVLPRIISQRGTDIRD